MKTLPRDNELVFVKTGRTTGTAGAMYDPTTITQRVKRIFRKLGFDERYSLHSLRKTWTTHQLLAGTPIHLVQAIGGWSSVSTLETSYSALLETYGHNQQIPELPY